MKTFLIVFLGGGLGSSLRFFISRYFNSATQSIPLGTLSVNILGSLFLGFLLGQVAKNDFQSANTMLFLTTGFCGGFTTFSAFAFENVELLKSGDYLNFTIYTLGSLILGFAAVFAGLCISRYI